MIEMGECGHPPIGRNRGRRSTCNCGCVGRGGSKIDGGRSSIQIEDYRFGSMTIDGRSYSKDLYVVGSDIMSPWWRSAGGHVFAPDDLAPLIEAAPEVIVLGTGYFGRVKVPDETLQAFTDAGTEVVVGRTGEVVDEFNRLADDGRQPAAAFHLTC